MTQETDYQIYKDLLRESLAKYTRKAFKMIPKLDKPCILDVGCGSVVPTMELARLSNGEIVGLDVNQPLLDRLGPWVGESPLCKRPCNGRKYRGFRFCKTISIVAVRSYPKYWVVS